MKKKAVSGFTLIELIVVMAVMTILMVALMRMMKPIRYTYIDSTLLESERNTESGISEYLTESVRYATNIGIYSKENSVTGVKKAEELFMDAAGISSSDDEAKNIQVITVDSRPIYSYGGEEYMYGRLIRKKVDGTNLPKDTDEQAGSATARLALGEAYYGKSPYGIQLTPDTSNGELTFTIRYLLLTNNRAYKDYEEEDPLLLAESDVVMRNIQNGGTFDTTYYNGYSAYSGNVTYIVFTLPD